jgi:hypothetical protein
MIRTGQHLFFQPGFLGQAHADNRHSGAPQDEAGRSQKIEGLFQTPGSVLSLLPCPGQGRALQHNARIQTHASGREIRALFHVAQGCFRPCPRQARHELDAEFKAGIPDQRTGPASVSSGIAAPGPGKRPIVKALHAEFQQGEPGRLE